MVVGILSLLLRNKKIMTFFSRGSFPQKTCGSQIKLQSSIESTRLKLQNEQQQGKYEHFLIKHLRHCGGYPTKQMKEIIILNTVI